MTFCFPYSLWKRQRQSLEIWYDLFPVLWIKHRTNSSFETEKVRVAHVRANTLLTLASKKRAYLFNNYSRAALIRNFPQECVPYLKTKDGKAWQLSFLILCVRLKVMHWHLILFSYFFFCLKLHWSNWANFSWKAFFPSLFKI